MSEADPQLDVAAAMEQLGVDREAYRVLGLLPLVYVAWADGKVQRAERETILRAAGELGWLADGGQAALERWLTERPTEAQLRTGIALLNHLSKARAAGGEHFDADDLHHLLLLCKDVADSAGGFLGLGSAQSAEEVTALEAIAEALDIKNARGWKALAGK